MYITKTSISRRHVLRGIGAAVALPFMDAMVPAFAKATIPGTLRFGMIYVPHGVLMRDWLPPEHGHWTTARTLAPLAPVKAHVSVCTGLSHASATSHSQARVRFSAAAWLGHGTPERLADSIDQRIAKALKANTRFKSLHFAATDRKECSAEHASVGVDCPCTHADLLSRTAPAGFLRPDRDPRTTLNKLFSAGSEQVKEHREASLLDELKEPAGALRHRLGGIDRARLDQFFSDIRSTEKQIRRIECNSKLIATETEWSSLLELRSKDLAYRQNVFLDLQVLAMQADLTRVTSLSMASEFGQGTYRVACGVDRTHHEVSHHKLDGPAMRDCARIDRYHIGMFADFLVRLSQIADGDKSLLDNSVFLYGSGMSDGNTHSHENLPILLAGGACGQLRGDRHLALGALERGHSLGRSAAPLAAVPHVTKSTPYADFVVDVLSLFGAAVPHSSTRFA